jgi:release factor glutamine methyltransferase
LQQIRAGMGKQVAGPPDTPTSRPNEPWTVRRIVDVTTEFLKKQGSETPRLDTEILLAHVRNCRRIELYTRYDELVTDEQRDRLRELVRRRAKSEPVAYLVGHREFFALDFRVTPDVLIPRPDTETLVLELLEAAKGYEAPRIVDLGTGSGCIAVAAAVNCPAASVTAVDVSEAAIAVARENAQRHKVADRIRFLQGDLFQPVGVDERFEVVVSNPPYVAEGELDQLQREVRLHEPRSALVAGPDGLDVVRRLIADSPARLVPGGQLLFEISPEQAGAVRDLLEAGGAYRDVRIVKDLSGCERVARASKRA